MLAAEDDWGLWKDLVPPVRRTMAGRVRGIRFPVLRMIVNADIVVARKL